MSQISIDINFKFCEISSVFSTAFHVQSSPIRHMHVAAPGSRSLQLTQIDGLDKEEFLTNFYRLFSPRYSNIRIKTSNSPPPGCPTIAKNFVTYRKLFMLASTSSIFFSKTRSSVSSYGLLIFPKWYPASPFGGVSLEILPIDMHNRMFRLLYNWKVEGILTNHFLLWFNQSTKSYKIHTFDRLD